MDNSVVDQLCNASARGNLAEVKRLLENGACVNGLNKFKRTALQVVMTGHVALIRELLAAGADPNARDPSCGLTVLDDAAREGFEDSVLALLEGGADPQGGQALHLAATGGATGEPAHRGAARARPAGARPPGDGRGPGADAAPPSAVKREQDEDTF